MLRRTKKASADLVGAGPAGIVNCGEVKLPLPVPGSSRIERRLRSEPAGVSTPTPGSWAAVAVAGAPALDEPVQPSLPSLKVVRAPGFG